MKSKKMFFGSVGLLVILSIIALLLFGCGTTKSSSVSTSSPPYVIDQSVPADQCAIIVLHNTLTGFSMINGEPLFPPPPPGEDIIAYGKKVTGVRSILIPAGTHEFTFGFIAKEFSAGRALLGAAQQTTARILEGKGTFEAGKKYEAHPNAKSDLDYANVKEAVFSEVK